MPCFIDFYLVAIDCISGIYCSVYCSRALERAASVGNIDAGHLTVRSPFKTKKKKRLEII